MPDSIVATTDKAGKVLLARINAAASTNATSVKASKAAFHGYDLYNPAAYAVYLKLFNKATAPTVGTDTPVQTIGIPAGAARSFHSDIGTYFPLGFAYAITKLAADNDTTVLVAGDLLGTVRYI